MRDGFPFLSDNVTPKRVTTAHFKGWCLFVKNTGGGGCNASFDRAAAAFVLFDWPPS
jgi:hypothetical protein